MAQGLPGYPSNKAILGQARALAQASVPSKRSILGPYNQSLQDTTGFTSALMGLLGQSQPGAGYDQAIGQQSAVSQAAAARLAALGGQYGAGSAAAVGGLGDSATSALIARGAAAKAYGAQLPAVAGARGQLFQQGLIHDRQTALQNRSDQLRSAFTQMLDQVQNEALARSQLLSSNKNAALDRQLQRESMAQNQAQFNASQAQQASEFAYEHSPQWLKMQADIQAAASGAGGAGNPLSQWTPGQISTFQSKGFKAADDFAGAGTRIGKAIDQMVAQGIPRPIAISEAANAYQQLKTNKPTFQQFNDGRTNPRKDYTAAITAWKISYNSFRKFAAMKQFNRWLKKQPHYQPTPPGAHGPGR